MAYTTQTMRPQDRADVVRLWRDNVIDPQAADGVERRWEWLCERNPVGQTVTVVAFADAEQAVGCGSAHPRRMQVRGEDVLAAVPSHFAVDRRHRIGGAALTIQRALMSAQPAGTSLLVAYPNESSTPIFKRVGYVPIGVEQAWVKPLRVAYKLKQYVRIGSLANLAAIPVDTMLVGRDATRAIGAPVRTVEVLDRADERFDRLWARSGSAYAAAGERSSLYLNWRYAAFTNNTYRFFSVFDPDGELVAYLAFYVYDCKAFVADVFAVDMADTAEDLFVRFARAMRAAGNESIFLSFVGDDDLGERLRRLGYYPSGQRSRQLFAISVNASTPVPEVLREPKGWYMFDGEMDI